MIIDPIFLRPGLPSQHTFQPALHLNLLPAPATQQSPDAHQDVRRHGAGVFPNANAAVPAFVKGGAL
jgi:hypothetical protein